MKPSSIFTLAFLLVAAFSKAQMDDKFYQPNKAMNPFEMKISDTIKLPVDDNVITAFIAKPKQKEIKKTIFYFHGAAGNVTTYQFMTKPLVDAGYQIVMIDLRGYGLSTGKLTHKNVAEDGQKFFDELIKREDIKNTKVYLYGASLGTQVAAHLAKDNVSKISGLILDCPMASFTDIAAHFAPQYKDFILQTMISPYSAKEDVKALNNLPVLVIHAKDDKTIPYEQGKLVFDNASGNKVFIESKGDHLEGMKNNREEILKAIDQL
ncbi:alpha/beta hydrolase [Chryseobacterium lactis]|uniref:Alpha/beta fold hydrolase n=1 Tax=Chryseobacterium lactis TaxID=1241981 RepID=A0A3G6RLC7_CHRLC|nr:alpha/beta fold hydrolase [Chryseobacterium lactis]AZA80683.1 alpha/beta fold hydrolase [Chryseobacterium lactis]AZB05685.1 alpha/beta fold hydrolase [Chryseobacterium lactis]PNW13595.1 alpha/beta hydrolase [Chryseobacterium lactis]